MSFWRKAGLFIAGVLLPLLLFVWGLVFSLYNVYGTPDNIKHALATSGIYQTLVRDVLQQQQKQEGQDTGEEIPLDNAEIQQIITGAASPELLQQQVETFLDSAYAWFSGQSELLNVQIDLTEAKTKLADGLTQHATNRLNSLPPCEVSIQMVNPEFDVFNATCVPMGVDKNAAIGNVRAEIDKAFKDPVLTQEDIKNDSGKTLEQQLQAIPTAYQNITLGLWVGILLILLCTAGVIWLSQSWRAGLKRAGWVYVSVGALSAALAVLAALGLSELLTQLGTDNLQASAVTALQTLAGDLRTWWLGFGLVVLLLGVGALVSLRFIKPGTQPTEPGAKEQDSSPTKNPNHEPVAQAKKSNKPKA